jgi:DNA-binding response OmpR family regulator
MTILLAEDVNEYARVLQAVLEKGGFKVIRVASGAEAYEYIKTSPMPDLLVTDVLMPQMSGFELLARLQQENRLPTTILLTSKQRDEDIVEGLGYGAVDYITKPFSPSVLLARVKNALAKSSIEKNASEKKQVG